MTTALDRLGFHFYPDEQHYSERHLAAWLPELQALGAHWLVLRGNTRRSVPEAFVRGLIEAGIQPVIHIPVQVGGVVRADLDPLLQAYAHWGVRHVVVHDRPNMRRSWREADWSRPNLVDRYLDALLPVLLSQHSCGLRPVLPALEPGGDYWDTAFLQASLQSLGRRAPKSLTSELVLGLHAWTNGHDLNWGAGGPAAWKDARAYVEGVEGEDQRGVRIFEWYRQIAEGSLGSSLPMIALSGGITPDQVPASPDNLAETGLAIRRMLASPEDAQGLQAFAFYPLAADAKHPDSPSAWYRQPGQPGPLAEAFKAAAVASQNKAADVLGATLAAGRRYILLPADTRIASDLDWGSLGRMAIEGNSTMGTSAEEASRCPEVVLAGSPGLYPATVLERLQAAGCIVLQRHIAAGPRPETPQSHAACPSGIA
ncbi:MAG: hypothetical protein MUO23_07435 [Anaerolineales bacterium]|nr:hypothetical protein [Anaerolineales bacterium]